MFQARAADLLVGYVLGWTASSIWIGTGRISRSDGERTIWEERSFTMKGTEKEEERCGRAFGMSEDLQANGGQERARVRPLLRYDPCDFLVLVSGFSLLVRGLYGQSH